MSFHLRPALTPAAWDVIESFVQRLQQITDASGQLRLTLEMLRDSIPADAVFLYSAVKHRLSEYAGPADLPLESLRDFAAYLVAEAGPAETRLLRSPFPAALALGAGTGSAGLARLSRSRGAWVIALRGPGGAPMSDSELKLMSLARRLLALQQQTQQNHGRLQEVLFGVVRCLTAALDARDPYTCGHSERVARIAVRLSEQLGLNEATRSEVYLGGLLHDIGKIGVPDAVLRKPGKLTESEFDMVRQHPVIGDTIVGQIKPLSHLSPLVRNHHEQYDGGGYPDGLAGEAIPLGARILAVADACDAMMSDRPYRKGMSPDRIEQNLREGTGRQWDGRLIDAFFACKEDVYPIYQRGLGDSVLHAVEHAIRSAEGGPRIGPSVLGVLPSEQGILTP